VQNFQSYTMGKIAKRAELMLQFVCVPIRNKVLVSSTTGDYSFSTNSTTISTQMNKI
ncbi:hypothetical protein Pmar_PMAR028762, partial [Perkinsus marinus ATCC 50983]